MVELIDQITHDLKKKIRDFQTDIGVREVGKVIESGDGIAWVDGLSGVRSQELIEFPNGSKGIAFSLEKERIGTIILGESGDICQGMEVRSTGRIASLHVGDELIGRVVNALGEPLDGKGVIRTSRFRPIERIAPGVVDRQDVNTPVQTGIVAIDAMIPIGRGQRELIIGDRQTGKTAIAIDTIINQKGKGLICIYVAIGQKKAGIARTIATLEQFGAMAHTVVVVAAADEPAAMQYIAPYAGSAIGEEFMESGRDAIVVFDDLSKHAWAYRQLSLLLRRPPGREAYPGDLFYLHSRLLERAARLAESYVVVNKNNKNEIVEEKDGLLEKKFIGVRAKHDAEAFRTSLTNADDYKIAQVCGSGGSLTAIPIIETLLGDVSAYVPTNVISITDGQIYLESNLFNGGIRPAINVGISVSRVGGDAQTKAMKKVAGRLRLDMAAFRELAAFAQFGSDLDKFTQAQLNRGLRLQEILKQPQYSPLALDHQIIVLFAGTNGYADSIQPERINTWRKDLANFMSASHPEIGEEILKKTAISDELEKKIREALDVFNTIWK